MLFIRFMYYECDFVVEIIGEYDKAGMLFPVLINEIYKRRFIKFKSPSLIINEKFDVNFKI